MLLLSLGGLARAAAEDPALIVAARRGDAAEVSRLLAAGADIEATDWAGWTALAWAALGRRDAVLRRLVAAGAEIDGIARSGRNSGTPLMLAARRANAETTLRLLLEAGADVDGRDQYGRTALMMAAREGLIDNIRVLLKAGARVDLRSWLDDRTTALAMARKAGHGTVAAILIAAGARD